MNANINAALPEGQKEKIKRLNKSDIQPRRMDFTFDKDIPLYWFDNSPFKSILLTALSCTFPEGERFFMRSVRNYQPRLHSEKLKEEVKGFIGQEAHHGNEHEHFNALMAEKGLPTHEVEKFVHNGLQWQEKILSPERCLAKTCALEHFTAILAELLLSEKDFTKGMDERLLPLWTWHAIEESEHKSVAFDVYQEQVGNYWIRVSEMAVTTLEFTSFTVFHYLQLRKNTNDKRGWPSVREGWNWLLGKPGFLRKLGPAYLSYYRRDFHPSKRDRRQLRDAGLKKLATMLNRPELLEEAV